MEPCRPVPELRPIAEPIHRIARIPAPLARFPDDRDRRRPRVQECVGGRREGVAMSTRPGTAGIVEVRDDDRVKIVLDAGPQVVGDEGEGLRDASAPAIGSNHGYLDRVVQRASLPAIRARIGRGIGFEPRSTRSRRVAPAEREAGTRLRTCHWNRAIRTDTPQQV